VTAKEVARRCETVLESHYGAQLKGLAVRGCAARNQASASNDIDLLVLLGQPFDYFHEVRRIVELLCPIQLESDWLLSAKPTP